MSSLFARGHGLLIGVGGEDLPCTVGDAEGLGEMLRDPAYCGYPSTQVQVLTAAGATRQHILDGLTQLSQTTTAEDTVVVYFSGHGYQVKSSMGAAYFLLPHGYDVNDLMATAVSGQELTTALLAIPHQKMLLLLDCCHAGGLDNIKAPGLTPTKSPMPPEAQAMLGEGKGRVVIASSQANELSYAGKPYSAFTLALIKALAGEGASKQDGYVRVADMAMVTSRVVPQRTHDKQHPILNFEQADNFMVAYYAGGETTPKGLPFAEEPVIEAEPGGMAQQGVSYHAEVHGDGVIVQGDGNQVATGGGVIIGGNVKGSVILGNGEED
ncbi:MAG: caspase family protein [bacterium]|nr:caspase family protein [bacterium]